MRGAPLVLLVAWLSGAATALPVHHGAAHGVQAHPPRLSLESSLESDGRGVGGPVGDSQRRAVQRLLSANVDLALHLTSLQQKFNALEQQVASNIARSDVLETKLEQKTGDLDAKFMRLASRIPHPVVVVGRG